MALVVYVLCLLTSATCAWLLLRTYRQTRVRLLLWSGLCFSCLALNNLMLLLDTYVYLDADLWLTRAVPTVVGMSLLIYGLVWETRA